MNEERPHATDSSGEAAVAAARAGLVELIRGGKERVVGGDGAVIILRPGDAGYSIVGGVDVLAGDEPLKQAARVNESSRFSNRV